jgi:hypothetical protein
MVKYVRSLPDTYYLIREVADMVGCTVAMVVWVQRHTDPPLGPTHKAQYGSVTLRLYTQERADAINEWLRTHQGGDGMHDRRGPTRLWTKTETRKRARAFSRARELRRQAVRHRERGKEDQAKQLDEQEKRLLAQLEKARLTRRRQVIGRKKITS